MNRETSDIWAAALDTLSEQDRKSVVFDGQHKLDILSDLGQLVSNAKENSIKKRWRFHRSGGGQTVILRDLFSKIVVWIDRFKEIGDVVVQYDPVHAALPWAGVRFLLQLAVGDINKFAFAVEGAETIARSISRHATFEQIYLRYDTIATRAVKDLEEALVKLYAASLIYLARIKGYFEEQTPKRMIKAAITPQPNFEDLLRGIDIKLANVDRQARLVDAERSNDIGNKLISFSIDQQEIYVKLKKLLRSIDSPICRMSTQLDGLEDHLGHSERVKILGWLSSQPYLEHHQQIKKKALPGSGQWLLENPLYMEWYKQSASSLLWLHGKPGSGKSTLVSLVIEDMTKRSEASQSALPVYFYCSRSVAEPERSNPDAVLASVLRQLSCVKPDASLLSPVIEKYRRQGEGFKSKGLNLEDSRDLIIRLVENYDMTIIVVDALDECDPNLRQDLLDAFEHILKESAGLIKIFISSRNDQDIVYTLRDYPNVDISSDMNTADIEAYVKTETQNLVRCGRLLRNSGAKDQMTASIIEHVSSGADGMFRWASLQLDVVRALKCDEDIRTKLGTLPPRLEQLYVEVYNNLISPQGDVGRSIIDNALKWLLCAQEELRASNFLVAVAANLGTDRDLSKEKLLELCNNLVVYDDGLEVFRFAHLSVREFLENKSAFAEVSCYSLAAECCLLQILASSGCSNAEHLMSDVHRLRLRNSPHCTKSSPYASFVEYANKFWMKYCRLIPQSTMSGDTNLGRIIQFFFSDKLGSSSPIHAWAEWYCGRVLNEWNSAAVIFQDFITSSADSLSRLFFVATYFGFSELLTSCLRDERLDDETKAKGLFLAAFAAEHENFKILMKGRENWELTEPMLAHVILASDEEELTSLLEKVPDTKITQRIIASVIGHQKDWRIAILLHRYPDLIVTNNLLEIAMEHASPDIFRLMLARAVNPVVTGPMLLIPYFVSKESNPISDSHMEKTKIFLDKVGVCGLTPGLMAEAAKYCDERVIEALLEEGAGGNITERVMGNAVARGHKIFSLILQHGGKVTDTVLDEAACRSDAQVWQMLLEQGYASSVNKKTLKLAVLNYCHGDIVLNMLLDHTDDSIPANELAELIYEVARKGGNNMAMRQILDRAKDFKISHHMLLATTLCRRYCGWLGRLEMLLDRSSEIHVTEDMLLAATDDTHDGIELIQMFLKREGQGEISEHVLIAAASNRHQGCQIMQFLLEQNTVAHLTEDVIICATQNLSVDLVLGLLDRFEVREITGRLLEAAASNEYCGGELLSSLLAGFGNTSFPEDLFIEAVGNNGNGSKVISVLEDKFGRINMTESLMAKCIDRATSGTIELLLSRADPTQLTKETLVSVMRTKYNYVKSCVAEKSLHIPVTTDILESAAQYGHYITFRYLWNRYHGESVPEHVINAAAKNLAAGRHVIFSFLLCHDRVEIGEKTSIAIASNENDANRLFDLLLEQGLHVDVTEGVPETLSMSRGIKIKSKFPTVLQLSNDLKVTENLFAIAASNGNEGFLHKISKFCGMASTPENWLDIARLYIAATWSDTKLLKTLIGHGVDPDFAGPEGNTALVMAGRMDLEEVVQILLSAGASPDGGPLLHYSPLCNAARSNHYYMVKLLVNAGASINFRDPKGRTPSMIAKARGHMLIFKYLEQCRMEQERRRQEIPNSASD